MKKYLKYLLVPFTVLGLFALGSLEVKVQNPSIYKMALKGQVNDSVIDQINMDDKLKETHIVLNKMWKNHQEKLSKLSVENLIQNIDVYNSEHKFLLNKSLKEAYAISPQQQLSPSMKLVFSKKIGKKHDEITDADVSKFRKNKELWRELSRLSNDVKQVAASL